MSGNTTRKLVPRLHRASPEFSALFLSFIPFPSHTSSCYFALSHVLTLSPCSIFDTYTPCLWFLTWHSHPTYLHMLSWSLLSCPLKWSIALQSTHDQVQISQLNFQAPSYQGTCFYSTAVPLILPVPASLQMSLEQTCLSCISITSAMLLLHLRYLLSSRVKLSCKGHLLGVFLYFFILFVKTLLLKLPVTITLRRNHILHFIFKAMSFLSPPMKC